MVLQYYQNLKEMTSNTFHIVELVVGFKCPHKIHLDTQCPPGYLAYQLTIFKPRDQIMTLTLLQTPPDSKSYLHLCLCVRQSAR